MLEHCWLIAIGPNWINSAKYLLISVLSQYAGIACRILLLCFLWSIWIHCWLIYAEYSLLLRCVYVCSFRVSVLGSREQMCIHPHIMKQDSNIAKVVFILTCKEQLFFVRSEHTCAPGITDYVSAISSPSRHILLKTCLNVSQWSRLWVVSSTSDHAI